MDDSIHPAQLPVPQLLSDCDVERTRRQGPGGQHRNKVSSAVVITHRPSGIRGEAAERRSQHQNHPVAVQRLRVQLAIQLRTEPTESPSELWRSRARGGSLRVNPDHADFPALLAEAFDVLAAHQWQVAPSGQQLGVSTSQLLKFCKLEPLAFQALNQQRATLGMSALK